MKLVAGDPIKGYACELRHFLIPKKIWDQRTASEMEDVVSGIFPV